MPIIDELRKKADNTSEFATYCKSLSARELFHAAFSFGTITHNRKRSIKDLPDDCYAIIEQECAFINMYEALCIKQNTPLATYKEPRGEFIRYLKMLGARKEQDPMQAATNSEDPHPLYGYLRVFRGIEHDVLQRRFCEFREYIGQQYFQGSMKSKVRPLWDAVKNEQGIRDLITAARGENCEYGPLLPELTEYDLAISIDGLTALHHAVRQNDTQLAIALIANGANIHAVATIGRNTQSTLALACMNPTPEMVKLLIERGALPLHDPDLCAATILVAKRKFPAEDSGFTFAEFNQCCIEQLQKRPAEYLFHCTYQFETEALTDGGFSGIVSQRCRNKLDRKITREMQATIDKEIVFIHIHKALCFYKDIVKGHGKEKKLFINLLKAIKDEQDPDHIKVMIESYPKRKVANVFTQSYDILRYYIQQLGECDFALLGRRCNEYEAFLQARISQLGVDLFEHRLIDDIQRALRPPNTNEIEMRPVGQGHPR